MEGHAVKRRAWLCKAQGAIATPASCVLEGEIIWLSGIGAVVLSGGLLVSSYGTGATPAEAFTLLDPLVAFILKLNPTLRWDTNNPSATRFTRAFPGAVLDKNTGLVWEQAPDTDGRIWPIAKSYCVNKVVGGTGGWRLPSVVELKSVLDHTLPAPYVLDTVFTGVVGSGGALAAPFWSATSGVTENDQSGPWWMDPFGGMFIGDKNYSLREWCARGPMQESVY